uniref:TRAP transporter small permease subunit n=1 Tax=Pusillimonas noertemannii TaxID=305977 RepID=UPI00036F47D7
MRSLLAFSRSIDALSRLVGKIVAWVILIVVVISATNAVSRKVFDMSSNAWLELQWYLFGTIFLLAAGYTLLNNEHVRVDVLATKFSERT